MTTRIPLVALVATLVAALLVALPPSSGAAEWTQADATAESIAAAVELSAAYVESAETVVIARADDYADALAGAPLAAQIDTSVLFVEGDTVDEAVLAEIRRLGAQEIIILGGVAAVSQAIEDQLVAEGFTPRRLAGPTRFETALEIARDLLDTADGPRIPDQLYIVEGINADPARGWPDAINAAAIAAATETPIIPVTTTEVPDVILDFWDDYAVPGVIVGGTAAVSPEVEDILANAGTGGEAGSRTVSRLAGDTRYQTSVATYDYGISVLGLSSSTRFVIPGCSYAEGLAAGAIAGQLGVGTVMVDCEDPAASPVALGLLGNALDLVSDTVVVGDRFSDAVVQAIEAAATGPTLADAAFCLRLLHHNDGESDIFPSDDGYGGLANLVTLANQQQAAPFPDSCADSGVVTVTSGDNFLAGPELQASFAAGEDQPVYDALGLSLVGYDALALGNHDFDFSPDFTERFITSFQGEDPPPFLSANLDFTAEPGLQALVDAGRIAPSIVVDKGGEQVGIIGLTTPDLANISSPRDVEVMQDIVAITQAQVDALNGQGVEHIVLISHLQGIEGDDGDLAFVDQISGVDAVVAGGGDEVLADPGDPLAPTDFGNVFGSYPLLVDDAAGTTVPVVTTAGNYRYLGRLELRFDADGNLLPDTPFDASTSRMLRVGTEDTPGGVPANQQVVDEVYTPIQAYVDGLETDIIATSEVRLNGDRPDIRVQETNAGNLVADSLRWFVSTSAEEFGLDPGATFVGVQNGGGIRHDGEDIGPGEISVLDTFSMVPFANFVSAFEDFTATELKTLLERAYFDVEGVNGAFLHLSNLDVEVDLSRQPQVQDEDGVITTPGERVRTLTLADGTPLVTDGEVVADAPTVTMAIVDFSARGGDGYPLDDDFQVLGATYQQVLQDYITTEAAAGGLAGLITDEQYPEGGEGRITITGLAS